MASSINASTSGAGGVITTADNSGILNLQTAGTTAITVDASQNVGIGTASPVSVGGYGALTLNGTTGSLLYLQTNASSAMQIATNASGASITAIGASLPLYFSTNSTERMRIDSSGNLLVGTTSTLGNSAAHLQVLGVSSDDSLSVFRNGSGRSNGNILFQNSSGTQVGYIQIQASATVYVTVSDYRLKEDVLPMSGALAKVQALKPVTYKWKADGSANEGFIAHELQAVCPQAVVGEKDAVDSEGKPVYQGIDTSFLVATLTAAIQELNAKVDAQAAEIKALKGVA